MKHKRFSDEQVIGVLKEHEAGAKVDDICVSAEDPPYSFGLDVLAKAQGVRSSMRL